MATAPKLAPSLQLKHILFATDFAPCSDTALQYARALAEQFGSSMHILHVLPPAPKHAEPGDLLSPAGAQARQAERQMARMLLRHPMCNLTHEVLLKRGPLWPVFEEVIRERDIDFIVLGTRGRRGLKKLVLGSVAEQIFRRATCPVMSVGPQIPTNGIAEGHISSILYATDFSSGSVHALAYAIGLARQNRARLVLLHVLPAMPGVPQVEVEQIRESCWQALDNLVSPAIRLACSTQTVVLFGSAADNVLRVAREQQVRLIVMGARKTSMGMAVVHLPWATAHRVVCEARCPVVTVRD